MARKSPTTMTDNDTPAPARKRAPKAQAPKPIADSKHPLAHLIPPVWFQNDYIGRKIGGVQDFDILDAAFDMKHNVLIEGPTGSAKTSLIYAWASKRGLPVVNVPCNGAAEPRSLFGGWVSTPGGGLIFVRGDLYLAAQYGGVGYFDEVNMMPPRIASVVHGLFDKRRQLTVMDAAGSEHPTVVDAHPDFFLFGAYNAGYTDTFDLNEAFKNRHAFKLVWGYSRSVETELVNATSLIDMADDLRRRVDDGTLRTPIPTNMLIEFEQFYKRPGLGFGFAVEMFLNAFHADERKAVQEVVRAYTKRIRDELANVDFGVELEEQINHKWDDDAEVIDADPLP